MGMSDKKTTSNTSQNTATTSTPNVPSWISDPAQGMASTIGALTTQGPNAFTPTTSALENQVTDAAAHFSPAGDYSAGTGAYGNVRDVEGQSLLTGLDNYMNPQLDKVVNPVLADYDVNAGKTRAAQAAAAAAGGAFGGSRYGIQEAATEGELARGRATTEGGLLNTAYGQALSASDSDAARRQAAMASNQGADLTKAAGLTGIDSAKNAEQLAGLSFQKDVGERATEEQQIRQQYPLTFAAQTEGLLQGLNPSLFTGSSSTGTMTGTSDTTVSDPMGQLSGLLGAASGFMPAGGLGKLFKGVTAGAAAAGGG